ncbi:hypothetical protein ACA910_013020 [Epithemia clementina (nom. ined.)]
MASSSTGATDPNGWLLPGTSPGSVMVKITNTSREGLNGQLAVVLTYMEDKSRYLIHTSKSQQQLSLKPDNLIKATWMEQMTGQYEMIQNHPDIQRKIREYYTLVQQKTGLKPEYVAGIFLVLLFAAFYFVGVSKTMLVLSFLMLVGIVIAPDLGSSLTVIARNFPMRVRAVIRQQIPVVGNRIADNKYLSMALVGLVLFFFLNAVLRSPAARSAVATNTAQSSSWTSLSSVPHLSRKSAPDRAMLEDYYKKGFEDGKAGNEFGWSLPVAEEATETTPTTTGDDLDEFSFVDNSGVSPSPPYAAPKKSVFDWSTMISIMLLGQSLYTMGKTGEGGWDLQLAVANLKTMEPWRMGMFGFSLYRVGSAFYRALFT